MFDLLRDWWLASAGDSMILFLMRMTTAAVGITAAVLAWWNVIRPNEWERTWANGSYTRLRALNTMRALCLTSASLYYVFAGWLEIERTFTPHRLMVANLAFIGLFLWHVLDQAFWRLHFWRKRRIFAAHGITPERS